MHCIEGRYSGSYTGTRDTSEGPSLSCGKQISGTFSDDNTGKIMDKKRLKLSNAQAVHAE